MKKLLIVLLIVCSFAFGKDYCNNCPAYNLKNTYSEEYSHARMLKETYNDWSTLIFSEFDSVAQANLKLDIHDAKIEYVLILFKKGEFYGETIWYNDGYYVDIVPWKIKLFDENNVMLLSNPNRFGNHYFFLTDK